MDLSGKKNKGEKTSKKDKTTKAKKQKPERKRKHKRDEMAEEAMVTPAGETSEDEVVTTESDISDVEEETDGRPTRVAVAIVAPFEAGIVHKALATAVNAQWGRTEEANIFVDCMKTVHMVNGVFVGDIVVRPSFVKRSKGSALL